MDDASKEAGLKRNDVADCQVIWGNSVTATNRWRESTIGLFCHAGNTNGQTIKTLTQAIETGFANDGFATPALVGDNSILEARLNDKGPNGLPWFDLGNTSTNPQTVLAGYVKALGVKHDCSGSSTR